MPSHVCSVSARQGHEHIQQSILNIVICNDLSYHEIQLISHVSQKRELLQATKITL
jgi:hypothetical protein